jgi:hypothetical protein
MFDVIQFAEALKKSADRNQRHLLLGNGFSIACRNDIFNYRRLLEQADFTAAPSARGAFDKLDTSDFERVVRALRDFSNLASLYAADGTQAFKDADATREILIKTIQDKHPELPDAVPDAEYLKCWEFLANFSSLFTLNYDLLLYWTQMKRLASSLMDFSDGFGRPAGALEWSEDNYKPKRTYFLHGALHLYEVDGKLHKYAWTGSEPPILVQVAEAIRNDRYPLFVCEGKAEEKMAVIKRSKYLMHGFKELGRLKDDLFIFGHSLRDEDKHILDQIKDSGVTRLFVGVRVADGTELVAELQGRAVALAKKAYIDDLNFFDAESAHVWR